jgi:hypothetical protein
MKTSKMLKVIYNGDFLCNIYPHATKWQVFKYRLALLTRRTLMVIFALGMLYGAFYGGRTTSIPTYVRAEVQVPVEVEIKAPVMERIAKCESGGIQTKNGQVVVNVNSNGTYDQGKYQINSIWNKKAGEMGLNLAIEKDNEAFAMYLYKNYGTDPWNSSKKTCWSK